MLGYRIITLKLALANTNKIDCSIECIQRAIDGKMNSSDYITLISIKGIFEQIQKEILKDSCCND